MRKVFKYIAIALVMCLCIFSSGGVCLSAYAFESDTSAIESALTNNLVKFLSQNVIYDYNRVAGSIGEYYSALALSQYLSNYSLQAKTNAQDSSIMESQDGMQEFAYYDETFGCKRISHNVIYTIRGASSDKRVVISTSYDNIPYGYDNLNEYYEIDDDTIMYCSQGVNASASSVAVLLTLAQLLPKNYFDFDIDIIFFGAGYQNNAGAKYYNQTMNKSDREKTMLMLDISRIGLGENVYYYAGEFSNKNAFYDQNLSLKQYKNSMHGASTSEDNLLGYTSAGYSSSTQVFEGNGLNVLHLFAGTYESGVFGGYCEYYNQEGITNTLNDTLNYINNNCGTNLISNMAQSISAIENVLDNSQFVQTFSKNASTWQYKMLQANIMLIWVVVLFVLIIITLLINYYLAKKSFKYASDNQIDGVMIQIDTPEDDQNNDKNKMSGKHE